MKRFAYAVFAFSLLLVSCEKEQELGNNQVQEQVADVSLIPSTIRASVADVLPGSKTAYTEDGAFSWSTGDEIAVYYRKIDGETRKQGWLKYRVSELSNENKMATFVLADGEDTYRDTFLSEGFEATGVAVYPILFARPDRSYSYGSMMDIPYSQNVPTVKMQPVASTSITDVSLTGVYDNVNNIYNFKTAGSVLAVTLNHVHQNATTISLVTNDKQHYPVVGDFLLSPNDQGNYVCSFGDGGTYKYYSDFPDKLNVPISPNSDDATYTVYFNLPVGTYEPDKLAIDIKEVDGEYTRVISKKIRKTLKTNANELLTIPELNLTYGASYVKVTGKANNPQMQWTANSIYFCVTDNSTNDLSKYWSGMMYSTSNTNRTWEMTYVKYNNNGAQTTSISTSKKYYFHYVLRRDSGDNSIPASLEASNVIEYGTIPFYYISSEDATSFAKQYNFTKTDGTNFWHPGTGSNYATTMTLAVSDDATRGNLMVSELYGKPSNNKKIYGVLPASDATSMTFTYNGDGSDQYFFNHNSNYFYVAQADTHDATASADDIVFTIADGPVLTCEKYLMMKYPVNNTWNEFISGVGLIFN